MSCRWHAEGVTREPQRIATTVAPRALRSIRSGHPWVFGHSVRTQKRQPKHGDLAVVFDDRRFVGIGFAEPDNPIAIRMLHHGSPTTIDAEFFAGRVDAAIAIREPLIKDPATTGYRLINGENDGLPGLIVDQYDTVLVVKIYTAAWLSYLKAITDRLVERCEPTAIVLRASRAVQPHLPDGDGQIIHGELPSAVVRFKENNLTFNANVVSGNKTGHFLDQRDNRQRVREMSEGQDVLDVFSSTGGFSVYAAAGGATTVTAIDISSGALQSAEANIAANGHRSKFTAVQGDAFEQMAQLRKSGRVFGVVVIDPPSFAFKQDDIDGALNAYRKLTRIALDLVDTDGLLVQASCSGRVTEDAFVETVTDELDRSRRTFGRIEKFGHPLDHPVTFAEGRYLKAIFARAT